MSRIKKLKARLAIGIITILIVIYGMLSLGGNSPASASGGLTVAPAYVDVSITPDEPEQFVTIGIRNDFSAKIQIYISLQGIDQQSGLLVPTEQPEQALLNSVDVSPSEFLIEPGQSLNVKLRIKDSPDLAPGGHYATLLIRQVATDQKQVALQPAISATIFVTKEQGAVRKLALTNIKINRSFLSLPKNIDLTFKNEGNTHIVPRAALSLTSSGGGATYANGVANDRSIPILPKKEIKLRTEVAVIKRPWLPRWYDLNVQYRYDGAPSSAQTTVRILYIPPAYFLPLILLLVFLYYRFHQSRRLAIRRQLANIVVPPRKAKKTSLKQTEEQHKNSYKT